MANEKGSKKLKRKRIVSSFPENLKSSNVSLVIQSATSLIIKIRQNNDMKGLLSPQRTIKMLIRGLGSSNTQVQKNYFAVLVSFLKTFNTSSEFSVSSVLDAITSELHATGFIKKGEEREILMGRVLAFGALVRSGTLQLAPKDGQTTLVTQFLQDMREKSYLPLVGDSILIDLLRQIDKNFFKSTIWPLLSQEVRPGTEQTLLIFHCLLVCEERFPSVVSEKYLQQSLGSPTVLSPSTVHGLLEAVKREKLNTLDHPAYSDIIKYVVSSEETLSSFWQEVEKEMLVEATTTFNKQAAAIKIFNIIVCQVEHASQILTLLTPKLLTWFMKKYKSTGFSGKFLHRICYSAIMSLNNLCSKTNSAKTTYSVLKKLIFNPGNVLFDQLSGTKVVAQLVGQLHEKQVQKLAEVLRDLITGSRLAVEHKNGEDTTRPCTNNERLHCVHLLCRLLHMFSTQTNLSWRLEQLTFLFDMGFFPATNIGVELADAIRESFYNTLNQKIKMDDLQGILCGVVEHINQRLSNGDQLRIKIPSEVLPAWNKMYKVAKRMDQEKKLKKEGIQVPKMFQTMFYHIGLHLFKEALFAKDFLQELHSVYERVVQASQSEEEPHWTEVVTEMFLSLLSRNSQRNLLGCIFSSFCHIMTPQNVHQILQVLDPTNNTNPLLNTLDSDSESSSEEGDGSEDELEENKEEDESSDDGMTDGDDDMEEDIEEKVNDKLRRAVIEALGDNGAMTDTESVDLDNMDESEAQRVDRALSAAFQAFKPSNKKKESSNVKALAHFRSRVLDLIEMWMTRVEKPPLDLTVDVFLKLMSLLEHSLVDKHLSQLETRVRSILKKLTGMTKKTFDTTDCETLHLGNILKSLLDKGGRTPTVYMSVQQELIECSLFIIKVSQHNPLSNDSISNEDGSSVTVYSVLKDAVNSYFTQRDCLIPQKIFPRLFTLNIPFLSKLAAKLPGYAFDPAVSSYRQTKAIELLIIFWASNRFINDPSSDVLESLQKMSKKLFKASVKMIEEPKGRIQDRFLNELKKAFQIIKKKNWLSDLDLEQHMKNLQQFHLTIMKAKKINSRNVSSTEPMDIETTNEKNIKSKLEHEVEEENDKSEDEENESESDINISEDDDSVGEEKVNKNEKERGKNDITEQSKKEENAKDSEQESSKNEIEDEESEEEELNEESSQSDSEEPPSKKAKKKVNKKKDREKLRRLQLLKNNSKKLRMESMSSGLNENVFSKYSLLLDKKSASPDR